MVKPTLKINASQFKRPGSTLGMSKLLRGIGNSDLFNVEYHGEMIKAMRGLRATTIYYNDKKVYLDLWEYATPAHTVQVYNANFDLIIKVQHSKHLTPEIYNRYCNRKKMMPNISGEEREEYLKKIVPWTFFCSKMMNEFIGKEEELIAGNPEIEQDGFFCGKGWKCRAKIFKSFKEQGIDCQQSSQELRSGRVFTDKEFLHKMRSSKYGIVLAGRSTILTDAKNRREIDYMMLKKPLLLNYDPYYYNEFEHGKHYIRIDEETRIDSLDSMYNIEEIAQNGYDWYKENASLEAIPKTFLQIMQDKFEKPE